MPPSPLDSAFPRRLSFLSLASFLILIVFIVFLSIVPLFVIAVSGGHAFDHLPQWFAVFCSVIPLHFTLLLVILLPAFFLRGERSLREVLNLVPESAPFSIFNLLRDFAVLMVLVMMSNFFYSLVYAFFRIPVPVQNPVALALSCSSPVAFAMLFFSSVILAPVTEELAFRHVLFHSAEKCLLPFLPPVFARGIALTFASFLFSVSHCSLSKMFPLFVLGAVLQVVCIRSRSVIRPVLLHSMHNAVSMCTILLIRLFSA